MADDVPDWAKAPLNKTVDDTPDWAKAPLTDPISGLSAAGAGLESGATFGWSPTLHGIFAQAGAAYMPYEALEADAKNKGVDPLKYASDYYANMPSQAYADASRAEQERQKQSAEQHPIIHGATNVVGSAIPMMLASPEAAPTVLGRAYQAAKMGAGYGALTGAAEGEGATGKLAGAATGAVTGAVTGALASPAIEGIGSLIGQATSRIAGNVRGLLYPESEAAKKIIIAAERDMKVKGAPLDSAALQAAKDANIPRALVDAGGETTRALAESAANTSPTARAALSDFIFDRFRTQSKRAASYVNDLVGGGTDVGATSDALKAEARKANKPAYRAAYNAGSKGLWSPELERITGSPAVVEAMKDAAQNGKTRAIADGFGGFNNPGVTVTQDGRLVFNKSPTGVPTYPNMQFWDYTYRNLRDSAKVAMKSGKSSEGGAIGSVADQLRTELDSLIPQYQVARQGAARFFGADDALEAGQKFATSKMGNEDARRAVGKMNPQERQLFMQGYASQLINKIKESGDNRSIVNVFGNSPADRERAVIALGQPRADQLEAYVRAERILDAARGTVSGKSTTAKQLVELGLAGTSGGLLGGFESKEHITGNPYFDTALGGAIAFGAMKGKLAVNENVAKRVGQMLASDDPKVLQAGFKLLNRNRGILNALRSFDTASVTAGGTQISPLPKLIQGTIPAAAQPEQNKRDGGRANHPDHNAQHKRNDLPHGAHRAPDGRYYIADKSRPGKYLRVENP